MSKKSELIYHILFWFFFIGLDLWLEHITKSPVIDRNWGILQAVGFALLQLFVFYANYLYICPRTIPHKRWGWFIICQIMLVFLFAGLRFLVEEIVIFNITGIHNYDIRGLTIQYYLYDNSYYVTRILLFSIVAFSLKYLWSASLHVNELTIAKKKAELQALKNQLSPHFLFNTLNSFYSDLYGTKPEIADDILKLSEMLRYVTYESGNDIVPLKDEIVFLQNYIDLFRRRFDNAAEIIFRYPEATGFVRIPSLLLIHFVENAIKHGKTDDSENPISFEITVEGKRLHFFANNRYHSTPSYDEPGIGYKNICHRLSLLYPADYTLEFTRDDNAYTVYLNIPILL